MKVSRFMNLAAIFSLDLESQFKTPFTIPSKYGLNPAGIMWLLILNVEPTVQGNLGGRVELSPRWGPPPPQPWGPPGARALPHIPAPPGNLTINCGHELIK